MKPSLGMSHTESGSSESAIRRSPRLVGKFGLRRSPRLPGKSAMTMLPKSRQIAPGKSPAKGKSAMPMPKRSQLSPCKRPAKGKSAMIMPESPHKSLAKDSDVIDHELTFSSSPGSLDIETIMRSDREHEAQHFRRNYTYRDDCREKKTCIHTGGAFSWEGDDSSGFTYVAVRGLYCTCVAFKRTLKHVEDRLRPWLRYNARGITHNLFGSTVIHDIEVLADIPGESCQSVVRGVRIDEPFAIVSVDPSISNATGLVKNEDKLAVVEYFQGILKKDMNLCSHDAEEAAIHALQLLYHQKFEPEDIWVASAFLGEHNNLQKHELKWHLGKINNSDEYKAYVAATNKKEADALHQMSFG